MNFFWFLLPLAVLAFEPVSAAERDPLAGSVVRSREYIVHRRPRKIEEFIGDVFYRGGGRELRADWAQFDHASRLWRARGNVQESLTTRDHRIFRGWGDEGRHSMETGKGELSGKGPGRPIRFETLQEKSLEGEEAKTQGGHDFGTAQRLEWDRVRNAARAEGNVHVWGDDGESWSDAAQFDDTQKTLTLSGRRPVTLHREPGWTGAIQADWIRMHQTTQRMEAHMQVQGWVLFSKSPNQKAP